MCEPTSIALAGLAVGGATAGAGIYGQQQEYDNATANSNNMARYGKERYMENAAATQKDVLQQTDTLYQQLDQVRQQSFAQIQAVANDARKGQSVAIARNAERGVMGRSANAAIDEFERTFLEFENLRLTELKDKGAQTDLESLSIHNKGQSIINSGYPQPLPNIIKPSPIVPLLQGASAGLSVASSLSSMANTDALKGLSAAGGSTPMDMSGFKIQAPTMPTFKGTF